MIVIGSMISLAYYLRVIAAIWMRPAPKSVPAIAGAAPEGDTHDAPQIDPPARGEPARGVTLVGGPSGGRCLLLVGVDHPRGRGDSHLRNRTPAAGRLRK